MIWSEEMFRLFEIELNHYGKFPVPIQLFFADDTSKISNGSKKKLPTKRPVLYSDHSLAEGKEKNIRLKVRSHYGSEALHTVLGTCNETETISTDDLGPFLAQSEDLLCIIDRNGKILRASNSFLKIICKADSDSSEKCLMELLLPENPVEFVESLKAMLKHGKISNQESRFRLPDGIILTLNWSASYHTESGKIYATARDISSESRLDALILKTKVEREKARAKDIFLANMSHEIRTPLNAIIGFNEILSKSGLNADQQKKADIISKASRTLSVIINDILDLSKLNSGKLELDFKPFRPEQVCKQVILQESTRARNKGIKLFFRYDTDIPEILLGDDIRLTQILTNLLSNAIKFTEKGHVEIMVRESARRGNFSEIVFRISDTGIGIPKDKIRKVFTRFSQAESYTTRMYGGTGLGLSIVKSLIRLHNGKLSVKSHEGAGSVFSFTLKYEISSDLPEDEHPVNAGDDSFKDEFKNIRLLIAEDNEHNQMLACSYLEKFGIQIKIATNGRQALEILRQSPIDLILMDLQMPVMDGISTTEKIRKELRLQTPIIACSAHAMASERRKCLESGMNDYLTKPYTEASLIQAIHNQLQSPKVKVKRNQNKNTSDLTFENVPNRNNHNGNLNSGKLEASVLQKIPEDIRIISEALQNQDWPALEYKAHHLISSLSVLQLNQGIELSRKLEAAAHSGKNDTFYIGNELITYLSDLASKKRARSVSTDKQIKPS